MTQPPSAPLAPLASLPTCFTTRVKYANVNKCVVVYNGLPLSELRLLLSTAFGVQRDVLGLKDPQSEVHFPLSLLSQAPEYFATRPDSTLSYELIVKGDVPEFGNSLQLSNEDLSHILSIFTEAAPTGTLDFTSFQKCFKKISTTDSSINTRVGKVLRKLFNTFDRDGEGCVDVREFLSGLFVLANSEQDVKISMAFDLYDTNCDGYISVEEMTQYLTAVFSVIADTSPTIFEKHSVDPAELASITARQCFEDADTNHCGRLSYEEFKKWYTSGPGESFGLTSRSANSSLPTVGDTFCPVQSLDRLRNSTGLSAFSTEQVFDIFNAASHNGEISRYNFRRCYSEILKVQNGAVTPELADVVDALYDAMDSDQNGIVSTTELVCGISILCGGTREDRMLSCFRRLDVDGDGYISRSKMNTYLTSVFKILFQTSPEIQDAVRATPAQLASATTNQAIEQADRHHHDRLCFEEFCAWANQPSESRQPTTSKRPHLGDNIGISLEDARRLTKLENITPDEAFEHFAQKVNNDGVLDRRSFNECFKSIIKRANGLQWSEEERAVTCIDFLFDVFDIDRSGYVDFVELASGLSLLCRGDQVDRIQATFKLYDIDGDGFISMDEMITYLTSVFRVVYELSPEMCGKLDVLPDELARMTAQECFSRADTSHDGKLSYEEFSEWATGSTSLGARKQGESGVPPLDSLKEARRLTNLQSYDVNDIFQFFLASADNSGGLNKQKFFRCFNKLILKAGGEGIRSKSIQEQTRDILERLWRAFDTDGNGIVDISELGCGLSVLCGGTEPEKTRLAFQLFDIDGNGFIDRDEMQRYLTTVFSTLYETSPEVREMMGVSSTHLAAATTTQCFNDCDTNNDGKLSMEEFSRWYQDAKRSALANAMDQPVITLAEARSLSGLEYFNLEELISLFKQVTNADGEISRAAFEETFRRIVSRKRASYNGERFQLVVARLFNVFDKDNNGVIDSTELTSGLSVLCGGPKDQAVQSCFNSIDSDGDGISLEEMIRYLSNVYRVLFAADENASNSVDISPEDLAKVTAATAFEESGKTSDGRLTYDEFEQWISKPKQDTLNKVMVAPVTLEEIRRLTNLQSYDVEEVFELFAEQSDEHGLLSRSAFNRCFRRITEGKLNDMTTTDKQRTKFVIDRLFDIMDIDGNKAVDFSELASGLSVLCRGSRDSKVASSFRLFDYNGTGFITLPEMTRYMRSVYRLLFETQPTLRQKMAVSDEELAHITATQAFDEAHIPYGGKLSLNQFKQWYLSSTGVSASRNIQSPTTDRPDWYSLAELRRLTNLNQHSTENVFEAFAEAADDNGMLTKDRFYECFYRLLDENGQSSADLQRTRICLQRLYDLFSNEQSGGMIDFSELASGLSVLCGGGMHDRISSAFSLYDFNSDGYISMDEMSRYLTQVFKILYDTSPGTYERVGVSPEELAKATATQAVLEADIDTDGRLSYDEFFRWAMKGTRAVGGIPSAALKIIGGPSMGNPNRINLQDIRHLTNLGAWASKDVFEQFAVHADSNGGLEEVAFKQVFKGFIKDSCNVDGDMLASQFFSCMDSDDNGVVDFAELSSGLSVLCGGKPEEKVRAAFALFDYSNDGCISLQEMIRYMSSVFRVIYETTPGVSDRIGVSSDELARITAEQCFSEVELNEEGKISFGSFKKWYTQSELVGSMDWDQIQRGKPHYSSDDVTSTSVSGIDRVRKLTKLDSLNVNEVFEIFTEAAPNGELTHEAFQECFQRIIKLAGGDESTDMTAEAKDVISRLFKTFDTDGNNVVSSGELASGLSVLCGSSMGEKVEAVFQLYDKNSDGFITLNEMTNYMTAIFKVMYETSETTRNKMGVTPEELAAITTKQCFAEADTDHDGKLSREEFAKWCTASM